MRSALQDWGLDADVTAFELAVSELVTNALVHGGGAISVALASEGGLVRLEVIDEGGALEPPRPREDQARGADGGWGLRFIGHLADRWGATSDGDWTRVWLVKSITGRGGAVEVDDDRVSEG